MFRDYHQILQVNQALCSRSPTLANLWTATGPTDQAVTLFEGAGPLSFAEFRSAGPLSSQERLLLGFAFTLWNARHEIGDFSLNALVDLDDNHIEWLGEILVLAREKRAVAALRCIASLLMAECGGPDRVDAWLRGMTGSVIPPEGGSSPDEPA